MDILFGTFPSTSLLIVRVAWELSSLLTAARRCSASSGGPGALALAEPC
jgi:hypothetical protein